MGNLVEYIYKLTDRISKPLEQIVRANSQLEIAVFNNRPNNLIVSVFLNTLNFEWKDDIDYAEIEAGRTKEISLFPYRVNNQVRIRGIIG